jgi:PhzF family phenazine biosynthesis protein
MPQPTNPARPGHDTHRVWIVDAFTRTPFRGNPAAVVPLDHWLPDDTLQAMAAEHNLSETAFFVPVRDATADADFELRWFTPAVEVALCGHATLAAAHTIFTHMGLALDTIRFASRRSGVLTVWRDDAGRIVLDFPSRPPAPMPADDPRVAALTAALGSGPAEVHASAEDLLCVFEHKRAVHELTPDFAAIGRIAHIRGVICTAPAAGHDFVSRFFAPAAGVSEDPVTGSAHCMLAPYWAGRLGKRELTGHQVSRRGGEVACTLVGDGSTQRVHLAGHAVTYMQGTLALPA